MTGPTPKPRPLLSWPPPSPLQPGGAWSGWRDIVTAPTDRTIVLAFVPGRGMTLALCDIGRWWAVVLGNGVYGFSDTMIEIEPSHWIALPDPPGR